MPVMTFLQNDVASVFENIPPTLNSTPKLASVSKSKCNKVKINKNLLAEVILACFYKSLSPFIVTRVSRGT